MSKQRARPTYTPEIARSICEQLAAGKSLRAICEGDEMPSEHAVRGWVIDDYQGFASQYARARDTGLDALADEALEIANTPVEGIKTKDTLTDREVTRADMIEHRRLQVDTRKWYLSKLAPKRYGDRLNVEHAGGVRVTVTTGVPDSNDASDLV